MSPTRNITTVKSLLFFVHWFGKIPRCLIMMNLFVRCHYRSTKNIIILNKFKDWFFHLISKKNIIILNKFKDWLFHIISIFQWFLEPVIWWRLLLSHFQLPMRGVVIASRMTVPIGVSGLDCVNVWV
jgi:hypothetical protein